MFVKKISLLNLRSYTSTEIEFVKGINLLIGTNNSGKSTIIKALYKLQNLNSLGEEDIRKSKKFYDIKIDLDDLNGDDMDSFAFNDKSNYQRATSDKIKIIFRQSTDIIETKKGNESLYCDNRLIIKDEGNGKFKTFAANDVEIPFQNFFGLPNLETQNNFIYPFFAKRKTQFYSKSSGEREAFYVADDLRNITSKVQMISNPTHNKYHQFLSLTKDILGFDIGVVPYRENDVNTGVFVKGNTERITIEQMGEGVVNILGLIVMLLTENRKLYLIEELENDIHPTALKKLLQLIIDKSADNQFVISTHSNIVLKYLGIPNESKIFKINWTSFEIDEQDKLPTSLIAELQNTPDAKLQLLESLGYDLFDFDLHKSYIIFEESSAEKIVRDFLIPDFVPSLYSKVKTLAASGASDIEPRFNDFLRLFVYIHQTPLYFKRAWVFADGDKTGLEVIDTLKGRFPTWPNNHFINFTKDNFEEYYPVEFQEKFKLINSISDKKSKKNKKEELTNEVVNWIFGNREEAKSKFAESAKEVIQWLKKIEENLFQS
jgi:AAA15 family ATPase/GTPase